jgi:ATP-binding cassette subfamily B protein
VITLFLDPVLSLTLIAVLVIVGFIVVNISKSGISLYSQLQKSIDELTLKVREDSTGIRVIKALSKEKYEKNRFTELNQNVVNKDTIASKKMAISNPLMNFFLNLGLILVIGVGAFRANLGLVQTGTITAFLSYFTIILNALLMTTRMFAMLSKGMASADRVSEVLYAHEDLRITPIYKINSDYHITFEDVNFSYKKKSLDLENINFSLKHGETLGIIGKTGSGKTTLISLLLRFYDADSGTIRINGQNIKSIPFADLYKKFGNAFQNDVLFGQTIYENIDFGRNLPKENIYQAATNAQAADFINSLDNKYNHLLTARGTNLSGGQKQRVLISRALASNPEILILDDSSSALDYKTDSEFRKALSQHHSNTTSIIIAQRISSIMSADHILVLDNGKVLGYGTHSELLASCESYNEIYIAQMGGVSN